MAKPPVRKPKKKSNPLKTAKVSYIDYKDTALLRKFISDRGRLSTARPFTCRAADIYRGGIDQPRPQRGWSSSRDERQRAPAGATGSGRVATNRPSSRANALSHRHWARANAVELAEVATSGRPSATPPRP